MPETKPSSLGASADEQAPPVQSAAELMERLVTAITSQPGPIVDRIERAIGRFTGSGEDVTEWLDSFEKRCSAENIEPHKIVVFLLGGNAERIYRMLSINEVIQWPVVRGRLLAQYGLPRHLAYQHFKARKHVASEPIDVYAEDLQRLGARLNVKCDDMLFKAQFYDGLCPEDFSWAVTRPNAYTNDFNIILAEVRDRVAARQSLSMRSTARSAASAADGNGGCHRCGGNHKVRDCPKSRPRRSRSRGRAAPNRVKCFNCQKLGHYARQCTLPAAFVAPSSKEQTAKASSSGEPQLGFQVGDASRDATSPTMEIE